MKYTFIDFNFHNKAVRFVRLSGYKPQSDRQAQFFDVDIPEADESIEISAYDAQYWIPKLRNQMAKEKKLVYIDSESSFAANPPELDEFKLWIEEQADKETLAPDKFQEGEVFV